MPYGRNDRGFPYRDENDDRQRLAGRWVQDDETGYLRRRFEDDNRDDDDFHRGRQDRSGGYYGASSRRYDGGGHAFDFARRDSRSVLDGREESRFREAEGRFNDPQRYSGRSGAGGYDRGYGDRSGGELPGGSGRDDWPERDNWISRYVSAEAHSERDRGGGATSSFRGKGPKGYVRSDERIKEDVSDRLSDDDTLDASEIVVEVSGGEVTLSGYVDSRQAKRTAEDCADQCAGVVNVQNNLRVRSSSGTDLGSGSSASGIG